MSFEWYLKARASISPWAEAAKEEMLRKQEEAKVVKLKPKQICYKSNEPCKFDCPGLCREGM